MAVHKTTSTYQIISKLRREFNPSGTSWIGDVGEYIGDAISAIGHHSGYKQQTKEMYSENFRSPYPNNYDEFVAVEYKGTRLKLGGQRNNVQSFYRHPSDIFSATVTVVNLDTSNQNEQKVNSLAGLPWCNTGEFCIPETDYLITSFESDCFILHYRGIPVDKMGLPLVPDTFNHKECISYYCMMKMISGGYTHPIFDFATTFKLFNEYLGKAQNTAKIPTIDDMEKFKNMWCRIVTNVQYGSNFFEQNQPEYITGI